MICVKHALFSIKVKLYLNVMSCQCSISVEKLVMYILVIKFYFNRRKLFYFITCRNYTKLFILQSLKLDAQMCCAFYEPNSKLYIWKTYESCSKNRVSVFKVYKSTSKFRYCFIFFHVKGHYIIILHTILQSVIKNFSLAIYLIFAYVHGAQLTQGITE